MRLLGGAANESIDFVAVFAFVAFAVVYFLAPVLGYAADSRGTLLMSLYALIGYGVLVLLQAVLVYFIYVVSSNNSDTGPKAVIHFNFIFAILKIVVFLASMGAFAFGLQKLRRGSAASA